MVNQASHSQMSQSHPIRPKIIGLTGGIGSGKSTLSGLFANYHIPTIDTDLIAREVVIPGSIGLQAILQFFGLSILQADGTLNRKKLRELIFNDPSAKQQLEDILHPLIQTVTESQINELIQQSSKKNPFPFVLIAIPLLVEGIQKKGQKPEYIDEIWVVDTPTEQQIERACQRDQSTVSQIEKIIALQATREQRLAVADRIIYNKGDLEHLKLQVQQVMQSFSKDAHPSL